MSTNTDAETAIHAASSRSQLWPCGCLQTGFSISAPCAEHAAEQQSAQEAADRAVEESLKPPVRTYAAGDGRRVTVPEE